MPFSNFRSDFLGIKNKSSGYLIYDLMGRFHQLGGTLCPLAKKRLRPQTLKTARALFKADGTINGTYSSSLRRQDGEREEAVMDLMSAVGRAVITPIVWPLMTRLARQSWREG
jgi:hypothetical protein